MWKITIRLCFLALSLTQSLPAFAATALSELRYGTDTTIFIGSPALSLKPSQIASDLLAGPVTQVNIGTITDGVAVVAYHRLTNGNHLLVLDSTAVLGGVTFGPRDVILYNGSTYSSYFAGASHSIPDGVRISGVALVSDTTLLLSFDSTVLLNGITFKPTDIAQWNGSAYSLFFDSATSGITGGPALQDFHYLDSNSHLLLSFDTSGTVGGVSFDRSDVLEYTPGNPGTWELNYRGSTHASGWQSADLTALWASPITTPGSPTITSITPGPGRVTIVLQQPGNTGGGSIASYSATCTASGHPNVNATSTTTTVIVRGLVAGVSYSCTATFSNGSYTSLATVPTSATPKPITDLTPILMLLLD
jgi:hypothetical protein